MEDIEGFSVNRYFIDVEGKLPIEEKQRFVNYQFTEIVEISPEALGAVRQGMVWVHGMSSDGLADVARGCPSVSYVLFSRGSVRHSAAGDPPNMHLCRYRFPTLFDEPRVAAFFGCWDRGELSEGTWGLLAPAESAEPVIAAYLLILGAGPSDWSMMPITSRERLASIWEALRARLSPKIALPSWEDARGARAADVRAVLLEHFPKWS